MKRIYFIYLLTIILLTGCATQRTSTIVSCDYDTKSNKTNYMVFPYGSVSIPDKWEKTTYNSVSRQQFFKNEEGVSISVSFGPCNKYEFNADNSKKGFDFVKTFYEWDSEYFVNNYRLNQEIIDSNEKDNYIIWRAFGENNNIYWDVYFLFGEKNGFARSCSILTTDKWTMEQKVEFLKEIYLDKKNE